MADNEWHCKKCGELPSSWAGDRPSQRRCKAGGDCVWTRFPYGSSNSRDWQCIHCGKHPSSFETRGRGSRPQVNCRCSETGFYCVWEEL